MACYGARRIDWASYLYPHHYAALDIETFKAWEKREISTYDCLYQFLENNKLDPESFVFTDVVLKSFERWLQSLGYYRATYQDPVSYFRAKEAKEEL